MLKVVVILSFMQLLLDCVVGLAVLVRCFTSKADTERLIVDKLGNGFSRPPFIVVIVRL
jgi:palmitoyltransferase